MEEGQTAGLVEMERIWAESTRYVLICVASPIVGGRFPDRMFSAPSVPLRSSCRSDRHHTPMHMEVQTDHELACRPAEGLID